jgi:tRNA 2-thiocytidine biosynthesis protein TtcA
LAGRNNTYQALKRSLGRALHRWEMIADGDRIVVGVSGGADSLTLMSMLAERLARIPIHYDLFAVYIDPGFEGSFAERLEMYCQKVGFPLKVEYTDYGVLGHRADNRENPCFLCSRLRRKRLFEIAAELGCNKLALGHNKDDIIETLFLNMCYAGEISTMLPVQTLFKQKLALIRPLAYTDENLIRQFANEQRFPDFTNPCPTAATSKRREIKLMLKQLYRSNKKIKGNIFRSMSHVKLEYLLK